MHKKCGGMTLIEVLVAFVVLSVTMAVILQIFTGGMRNARLADSYSRAVLLAESKLAAAGVESTLVAGEDHGRDSEMQWSIKVIPVDDDGAGEQQLLTQRLYQLQVRVEWSEDGRNRNVLLDSLRLGLRR